MRTEKRLYCIVSDPVYARNAVPDTGYYSPKELAAKEFVSTTAVYTWIKDGLPVMRQGKMGNIRIYYQDYIQWMIDCAMEPERATRDIPSWAFRFVKSATPKKGPNAPRVAGRKPDVVHSTQKEAKKMPSGAEKRMDRTETPSLEKTPSKTTRRGFYTPSLSFLDLMGFAV